jgi:tetratricopeptide (TPR) repeat protein
VSRWQAALATGLMALALGSSSAWPLGDTEVTATDCGIAAGRDASNNTVTCNYGLRPEQVKELTEAAARGATAPLTDTIVALSKQLGVTEDATKTLLRIVGEQDVPLERLSETLAKVANDYQRLQAQAAALNPDNPTARDLVKQAEAEIAAGHFPKAHQLLGAATQAQIAAAQQARQLRAQAQAAEEAQLIGAAASTAVEGDLALTERDYLQAAEHFAQAAALVPPGQEQLQAGYRERQADAFYRQGEEKGDNAALGQAIAGYRDLLEEWTRARAPLDWARTQMNLGRALQSLGERLRREDLLSEALQAVRQAQAIYVDAGLRQYDEHFATRIEALEAAVIVMGKD